MDNNIKTDFPLAKHFIKKGKQITEADICYVDSKFGELVSFASDFNGGFGGGFFGGGSGGDFFSGDVREAISGVGVIINGKNFIGLRGFCALQDIEKYTPLTKEMFESCMEKERREQQQKEQEHQRELEKKVAEKLKEIEKERKSFRKDESTEDEKEQEELEALKKEMNDNIWL